MRTIETKIYNWEDIEKDTNGIRNKILDKYRYYNVESGDWSDSIAGEMYEKMEDFGYEDIRHGHTGSFGVRGEGAYLIGRLSLTDKVLNRLGIETDYIKNYIIGERIKVHISKEGSENWFSLVEVDIQIEFTNDSRTDEWLIEKGKKIKESIYCELKTLSMEFLKNLSEDYLYITSDSGLIEYFANNYIEFYENGEMYVDEPSTSEK